MAKARRFAVQPGWQILLADMGVPVADVLRHADLPADLFRRADASLAANQYFALWQALEDITGSSELPLLIGRAISVESFDAPIFAALCSPDLNVALGRLSDYKRLIGPLRLDVQVGTGKTRAVIHCDGYDGDLPVSVGATELVFLTQLARIATRRRVEPIALTLSQPPADGAAYREFFGRAIRRGEGTSIAFAARDASAPFLTENLAMWRAFEPDLRQRLAEVECDAGIVERVRSVLLEMLPGGLSSIDEAARRLAMSKRSLQRHLRAEARTYQDVLNETRRELAEHYLVRSTLPPSEISFLIGFRDSNSFLRAFNGWTGQTPGEFRRARPGAVERPH